MITILLVITTESQVVNVLRSDSSGNNELRSANMAYALGSCWYKSSIPIPGRRRDDGFTYIVSQIVSICTYSILNGKVIHSVGSIGPANMEIINVTRGVISTTMVLNSINPFVTINVSSGSTGFSFRMLSKMVIITNKGLMVDAVKGTNALFQSYTNTGGVVDIILKSIVDDVVMLISSETIAIRNFCNPSSTSVLRSQLIRNQGFKDLLIKKTFNSSKLTDNYYFLQTDKMRQLSISLAITSKASLSLGPLSASSKGRFSVSYNEYWATKEIIEKSEQLFESENIEYNLFIPINKSVTVNEIIESKDCTRFDDLQIIYLYPEYNKNFSMVLNVESRINMKTSIFNLIGGLV
jgi:hypothetical protein